MHTASYWSCPSLVAVETVVLNIGAWPKIYHWLCDANTAVTTLALPILQIDKLKTTKFWHKETRPNARERTFSFSILHNKHPEGILVLQTCWSDTKVLRKITNLNPALQYPDWVLLTTSGNPPLYPRQDNLTNRYSTHQATHHMSCSCLRGVFRK